MYVCRNQTVSITSPFGARQPGSPKEFGLRFSLNPDFVDVRTNLAPFPVQGTWRPLHLPLLLAPPEDDGPPGNTLNQKPRRIPPLKRMDRKLLNLWLRFSDLFGLLNLPSEFTTPLYTQSWSSCKNPLDHMSFTQNAPYILQWRTRVQMNSDPYVCIDSWIWLFATSHFARVVTPLNPDPWVCIRCANVRG